MDHTKKFLTTDEVGLILHLSRQSIARLAREGIIPGVRISGGRRILIPSEAVESVLRPARKGRET